MIKKLLSLTLVLSLLFVTTVSASAASYPDTENPTYIETTNTEKIIIEGETVQFHYSETESQRSTIVTHEDGSIDTFTYIFKDNTLLMNGQPLDITITPVISTRGWKEYDITTGRLNVSGMTLTAAVAAISAATGLAGAIISGAIASYIGDNVEVWISWKTKHYYWDPVETSRPKVKKETNLYYGKNYDKLIHKGWTS